MADEYEQDLLTCGKIVALRVLKETKDEMGEKESLDDVDFDYLIEVETRNLHNPAVLNLIEKLP